MTQHDRSTFPGIRDADLEILAQQFYERHYAADPESPQWEVLTPIQRFGILNSLISVVDLVTTFVGPRWIEWAADRLAETDPLETALGGVDYPLSVLRTLAEEVKQP